MELVIIITLIGILTSIGINVALRTFNAQKVDSTLIEMEVIKESIIGDKDVVTRGRRGSFGYFGDMGVMPQSLSDLIFQGSQPALTLNSKYNINFGWGGPYLSIASLDDPTAVIKDTWNNAYVYSDAVTVNGSGDTVIGNITSLGADGTSGGSGLNADIDLEILEREVTASVYGSVYQLDGNPMVSGKVYVWFPDGTANLKADSFTTTANGTYSFSNIPKGSRAVSVAPSGGSETSITSVLLSEGSTNVPRINNINP